MRITDGDVMGFVKHAFRVVEEEVVVVVVVEKRREGVQRVQEAVGKDGWSSTLPARELKKMRFPGIIEHEISPYPDEIPK